MLQTDSNSENGTMKPKIHRYDARKNYNDSRDSGTIINLTEVVEEPSRPTRPSKEPVPSVTRKLLTESPSFVTLLSRPLNNLAIWKKIALCLGITYLGLVVFFVISSTGMRELGASIKDLGETEIPAVRSQMEADMMHDGLRAVVLRALVSTEIGDKEALNESVDEVKEFSDNFAQAFLTL